MPPAAAPAETWLAKSGIGSGSRRSSATHLALGRIGFHCSPIRRRHGLAANSVAPCGCPCRSSRRSTFPSSRRLAPAYARRRLRGVPWTASVGHARQHGDERAARALPPAEPSNDFGKVNHSNNVAANLPCSWRCRARATNGRSMRLSQAHKTTAEIAGAKWCVATLRVAWLLLVVMYGSAGICKLRTSGSSGRTQPIPTPLAPAPVFARTPPPTRLGVWLAGHPEPPSRVRGRRDGDGVLEPIGPPASVSAVLLFGVGLCSTSSIYLMMGIRFQLPILMLPGDRSLR